MTALVNHWIDVKVWLEWALGLPRDALHVHLSLVLLFGSAILLRRRPDSVWCWAVVLLLELANEGVDGWRALRDGDPWLAESAHDVINTMLWPTMILIFGRWLWPRAAAPEDASEVRP